jgi:AraC-like DNA-binding protein
MAARRARVLSDARRPVGHGGQERELVSIRILGGYEELVHSFGGDPLALMRRCGIDPALVADPQARVALRLVAKLLELTAAELDCPDLGMRLGAAQDGLQLMGSVRPALESAPTIGDYYRCASAHMYVYSSAVDIHLEPLDPDRRLVRFHINAEDVVYRRQLMEQLLTINRKDAAALSRGRARPREIWFSHARLAPQAVYDQRFGARVRFSQPFDGAIYGAQDMAAPIATYDPRVVEDTLKLVRKQYPRPRDATIEVKRAIHYCMAYLEDCTRESVAQLLGIHARTLHRRLHAEGRTFEDIRDEVRRTVVAHYLAQSDAALSDITEWLNYSEPTAFSRACRRWFGAAPGELRASLEKRVWSEV